MITIDIHGTDAGIEKMWHIATGRVADDKAFDHFLYMLDNPNGYDVFGFRVHLAQSSQVIVEATHYAYSPHSLIKNLEVIPATRFETVKYVYVVSFRGVDTSRYFIAMRTHARTLMRQYKSPDISEELRVQLYGDS